MNKYKIHGSLYEPGAEGCDREGYIHFFDIFEAENEAEAKQMAWEDYGEYNHLDVDGFARSKDEEKAWIARNEDERGKGID